MNAVYSIIAVSVGVMIGALLRSGLSLSLNSDGANIPIGTLCANLLAAYFVGVAAAVFDGLNLPPVWTLFIITGLAGGLSTFSTFAAELLALLRDGRLRWSAAMVLLHVGGSLIMTVAGMASVSLIRGPG
ncbi:fluoride efflux transporter CrcB [Duganella sp. CY42W]|jgi:CrcB protein|uniref:Fluoride-specific ion channel FluC n=1 Tax=Duganella levis TaxID=2692169 RepID=A0ABW9VUN3_9BURK|nr:fluoride efflux transporter CrcB [Duganella levis]MYN25344.1 fluoride efflux transporter CrcB [Duganella levis]